MRQTLERNARIGIDRKKPLDSEQIQDHGSTQVDINMGDRAYHLFWAGAPAKSNGI